MTARRIRVELDGAVQGMGFRPFVHRLAGELGLAGFVRNTGSGLAIEAEGDAAGLDGLLDRLAREAPALARVTGRRVTERPVQGGAGFAILASEAGAAAAVLPDLAPCAACLRELFDPGARRYRHPFIACTQCGPRYSVIEALPYDRARTTLRRFPLCAACAGEYADPADRRFHAEAICCPGCGPRLWLARADGAVLAEGEAALGQAVAALRQGGIVALKGLGGFQLLADARDAAALGRLRARKRRARKPFAVLVADLQAAAALAHVDAAEARVLAGPAAPIVLLRARGGALPGATGLAAAVAPGLGTLGLMLPATPLHHLLARAAGGPLVATSGNLSGGPLLADNGAACAGLGGIAELFLLHDRPIAHAVDDSVLRVIDGAPTVLRLARGHAPLERALPAGMAGGIAEGPVLALGGHMKSALALGLAAAAGGARAVLGPHIADLEGAEARTAFAAAAGALPALHGVRPARLACDAHPDYASTRHAETQGLRLVRVAHHLAHARSGMLDRGLAPPLLAVAWDGAGHGGDGTIHGGEFLAIGARLWRRAGHLLAFRLPGGTAAMREPRRAALGVLFALGGAAALAGDALPPLAAFGAAGRRTLAGMLAGGVNAPWTSSAGRLFDAVAALLGLVQCNDYEGEAAMALEAAAGAAAAPHALPPPAIAATPAGLLVLDWRPSLAALLAARAAGAGVPALAAGFHAALAGAIVAMAGRLGARQVLLTGGCFQNALLAGGAAAGLRAAGHAAFCHRDVPPGDGGLALGQLAAALHPLAEETG